MCGGLSLLCNSTLYVHRTFYIQYLVTPSHLSWPPPAAPRPHCSPSSAPPPQDPSPAPPRHRPPAGSELSPLLPTRQPPTGGRTALHDYTWPGGWGLLQPTVTPAPGSSGGDGRPGIGQSGPGEGRWYQLRFLLLFVLFCI